jgi:hypothetical protein
MRTPIAILVLPVLPLLNCGCSMLVLSQGKDLKTVFAPTATRQSIERELGPPVGSKTYMYPLWLSDMPEIPLWARWEQRKAQAEGYADYCYRGSIYDVAQAESGDAECLGMTYGLSEFLIFPGSLQCMAEERKKQHYFRVWYSPSGCCVAYRELPAEKQNTQTTP